MKSPKTIAKSFVKVLNAARKDLDNLTDCNHVIYTDANGHDLYAAWLYDGESKKVWYISELAADGKELIYSRYAELVENEVYDILGTY